MFTYPCLSVFAWALSLVATSASPTSGLTFSSYNDAGLTEAETLRILRRALSTSGTDETVNLFDETLDKSWDGATLFAITMDAEEDVSSKRSVNSSLDTQYGVQIVCTTCYIAGRVSGQLTRNTDFNITELEDSAIDMVKNITEEAGEAIKDLADGNANYTEINFNVEVPSFPDFDYRLQFRFDDLELYMKLDTVLSVESTYTINLYTSESPVGYSLGDKLEIGAFFTVDLILTAAAEVDISSGVHIKVDGAGINLQMFNSSVDSITLDGGKFEFLPVNVAGAGFVLTGALRVGLHAGITFDLDTSVSIANHTLGASAGLEAGVFANIAEFVANVTYDSSGDDDGCELALVESFTMGLGAAAGASAAFDGTTWGPTPETEVPIWYTELGSACAAHRSSSSTTTSATSSAPPITARDATGGDLSLTLATITTETTSSGVACISPGLINCPVSLQTTKTFTATLTSTTSVPYGSEATWPATTTQTPVRTVAFGSNAKALSATTGSPVSYVPPPPPPSSSSSSSSTSSATASAGHESHNDHKPLIIGLSVGLGVPALAVVVGLAVYLLRRWPRYTPLVLQKAEQSHVTEELQPADSQHVQQVMLKRMTTVEVDETDRVSALSE
ncbi:uncharacterized protein Z520_10565 [Fonsecaea multimorphosa CBS 102226]|uniref:Mid2 domain-containing protein n=1 Tax=Fonsecaea multimorphosa CBS 102226 TaxID=1442371 RepID=A0A0D2JT38_9EURO|nr:uncharacterized protein Z520_10565 [Fonsecaea multimorphosa CBS 102226]KIX93659.1 hypothetical protein Z520_10565 [Fonsecaea multimorphosa CBS 102226]OAL19772.1 hypothetical protein AYO22_09299 [Fonsecaea multimorphosa]